MTALADALDALPKVELHFGWGWPEMVEVALAGVEASWLDEADKAVLRRKVEEAGPARRPTDGTG